MKLSKVYYGKLKKSKERDNSKDRKKVKIHIKKNLLDEQKISHPKKNVLMYLRSSMMKTCQPRVLYPEKLC